MKRKASLAVLGLFSVPAIAFAQVNSLGSLIFVLESLLNALIPLIIGAALVLFLYGLLQYVTAGDKGRESGIQYMVWGIIALFVMVSVWGLVNILDGTFGLTGVNPPPLPQAPLPQ